ncbi:hypothetical protein [Streptomyces sp. NPDC055990]|uniref:hypothetical protein n=1 Tax=Streptomyces sp. NPDC055990 TaxID=3345672 RepID=UPI0035DCFD97
MSDDDIQVFPVAESRIKALLWSREDFSGTYVEDGESGAAVLYVDGLWTLNLFLLELAWEMGSSVEPELEGRQQVYHTLAQLMMGISEPVPSPEHGPEHSGYTLPAVRIVWSRDGETGSDTPGTET